MVRWFVKLGWVLLLGSAAHSLRADTILLRSSARVSAPVALRDIADLEGPDAQILGDLIIVEKSTEKGGEARAVELTIDELRASLNQAKHDIRWGKIALNGDKCSVRLISEKQEAPAAEPESPLAPATAPFKPLAGPTWHVVSDLREESLRSAIGARLAGFLKAKPSDVRIAFAAGDAALLDTPSAGRTLDIQPTGLGASVPVLVRIFEGERVVAAGTVKVRVEQKLQVVGATRALHRGDTVTSEVIFSESRWTTPGERLALEESVLGRIVKNRVQPGELFLDGDVEAAILVKRGDIVNIACISGSIVMNTKARALANAVENETIEFAPLRNPRNKVTARVVASGQAVIGAPVPEDHVFQNEPSQDPALSAASTTTATRSDRAPAPPGRAPIAKAPELATVGSTTVQRITTKPDGTFVVEAATKDPKKPVRKMKFIPLDEP